MSAQICRRPSSTASESHFTVEFRAETEASFKRRCPSSPPILIVASSLFMSPRAVRPALKAVPTHGAPSCVSGCVRAERCDDGWNDADGEAANGCECQDPSDPGDSARRRAILGSLSDTDGDRASWTGILPTQDDVDVLRFSSKTAPTSSRRLRRTGNARNNRPGIQMCVYRHKTASTKRVHARRRAVRRRLSQR